MIDKSFVQTELFAGYDFIGENDSIFIPEYQQSITIGTLELEGSIEVEGKLYLVKEEDV
jgi:hypothetical protein